MGYSGASGHHLRCAIHPLDLRHLSLQECLVVDFWFFCNFAWALQPLCHLTTSWFDLTNHLLGRVHRGLRWLDSGWSNCQDLLFVILTASRIIIIWHICIGKVITAAKRQRRLIPCVLAVLEHTI